MEISVRHQGGARVVAQFGGHTVITDQPVSSGGEDSAPSPFDLFLVSIATCAGYYVYDFCSHRNIPTEGVRLIVTTHRGEKPKMLSKVAIEVHLPNGFPEKYEAAVLRAVDVCTVKRHLVEPPAIEVRGVRVEG